MSLLHLQCLRDLPEAPREIRGILGATGLKPEEVEIFRPFDAPAPLALLDRADAVTIGGSGWSSFEDIPHYPEFLRLLSEARRRRIPTFGICFGAQTMAWHFEGAVVRDEPRAEYGTIEVELTGAAKDDPLFSDMPARFAAQSWHHDRITELPLGAVALATSQGGAVLQAFTFPDEPIWAVQFHPERDLGISREVIPLRCAEDPARRDAILAGLRASPEATALLRRFADRFVRP